MICPITYFDSRHGGFAIENMDNSHVLVSIGVPVYNGERFLRFALESLLSQTHTNLEIIISDNASTDGTEAICRSYAAQDKRIRYYRNERNLGAARNYNLTFEKSSGKYFKWAAHDDMCDATLIEKCVKVLENEPSVSLAYAQTTIIDDNGAFKTNHEDKFNFREREAHRRWVQFCKAPLDCNAVFGVMRADLLRETPRIGPYESSDRVLLGEMALRGEIAEVPGRLFLRRYHGKISTNAHATKQSMAKWFDPASTGRFSRTKRFAEYVKSIFRPSLRMSQRLYCMYHLVLFYLQPARWIRLVKGLFVARFKDVRTAGNQI